MAELDTAAERAELADPAIDADSMLYVLGKCTSYLDAYDRLRAENQRLKLAALTADRESMELEAGNQRLEERHEAMADALVVEVTKRGYLRDEVASVLQLMDGLAEQWGDEAVFRRCRDRLRAAVESTGGGDS